MKAAVKCKLLLYADDSALLVSGKDGLEIERILSVELGAVNEWLCENRLSLHLGKTQSILFGSKKHISKCSELHVTCNGSVIGSESEVTYLGAILDQTLLLKHATILLFIKLCHIQLYYIFKCYLM